MTQQAVRAVALVVLLLAGCGCAAPSATPTPSRSTPPAATPCPFDIPGEWNGGNCLGSLPAGTSASLTFTPSLVYETPEAGWANVKDYPGNYVLLPPGEELAGINAGTSDYVAVFTRVYALSRACATERQLTSEQPQVGHSAAAIAREISTRTGVVGSDPKPVSVGNLEGYVVDLRIAPEWKGHCFFDSRPTVPIIGGLPPSDLIHVLQPSFSYRYYLLDRGGSTLAIEIQDAGVDDRASYDKFVQTFRFVE